ncbi:hypothetical protein KNU14_gp15 [Gordonia phage Buggaboo]|uniref:Uncharacterized protein n=1 Tax=Gordonia phage Buggaboo TaxID=2315529 RepID=A0A386KFS8_9CAUD|nr:hypothetical protein KNU14_gp15 [Gordonia phage Buggaboo]AVE00674.1 hypothetical protein SEA_SUPERSULLEY_15 [Gordonia phage SuperSulley]AYD83207.1 hypothetical protein SEA_BUGGABOO_15 [Gordonia phage Buggaboo]
MSTVDIVEDLTTEDYIEASKQLLRVHEKRAAGKKLSKKDRAIITYAALMLSSDRAADLYRGVWKDFVNNNGEPMEFSGAQKARRFESMLQQGVSAAERGYEVGEPIALRSILEDFREIYSTDLL